MRVVDLLLAFPRIVLLVAAAALFDPSLGLVVVLLGLTGWMDVARLVRGEVLSIRERPYVRAAEGLDLGRGRIIDKPCLRAAVPCLNQNQRFRFAFRTPPLRNVTLTAPYMHNGAFSTLEDAVRHHLEPEESLRTYDPTQHLPPELQDTVQDDAAVLNELISTIAPVTPAETLTDAEYTDLLDFLTALTDPAAENIADAPPDRVPSGLSITIQIQEVYLPYLQR